MSKSYLTLFSIKTVKQPIFNSLTLTSLIIGLSACSTTEVNSSSKSSLTSEELISKSEQLNVREVSIAKREAELKDYQSSLSSSNNTPIASTAGGSELLPPNPQPGQCYARVWVEPTYRERMEQILVGEESEKIDVIPASYEMVSQTVLNKPESTKLITIPASYETITEQKLIKEGGVFWKTSLKDGKPVDPGLLNIAKNGGIDLDSATPGSCYHEHYIAAQFTTEMEEVLVKEESELVELIQPEYRWVENEVLVSEASSRLEQIPARYETQTEQILDKPAHTVWKKGSGPIQKLDQSTGEIMCLVEVPASYRTVTKNVLISPAATRSVEVPAQYKTVKVRELVSDSQEIRKVIPAEYKAVTITKQTSEPSFVWHEVNDATMSKHSRTGKKICLTEEQPVYETVQKRIVSAPAQVQKVVVPAEYETVEVRKLVKDAEEIKSIIPASYKTVTIKEIEQEGKMEWRTILCETNMTPSRITDVQRALDNEGYNPGAFDGVIGNGTMAAVNAFQRDNNLPVDKYLNIETLEALQISAK